MTDDTRLRQAYEHLVATPRPESRAECASGERLLAVVEREGPEAMRLETMEHVMQCAACRRDLELLRAAVAAATGASALRPDAPVRTMAGRRALPVRALAAAAGIVFVVGAGIIVRERSDGPDRGETPRFRSGGRPQLTLLPPVTSADGSVLLQWRSVPNAVQYRVEVFDAGGRTVATSTGRDTTFTLGASVAREDSLRYVVTAVQADAGEVTSAPGTARP